MICLTFYIPLTFYFFVSLFRGSLHSIAFQNRVKLCRKKTFIAQGGPELFRGSTKVTAPLARKPRLATACSHPESAQPGRYRGWSNPKLPARRGKSGSKA